MGNSMWNKMPNIALTLFIALPVFLLNSGCSTAEKLSDSEALKVSRPVIFSPAFTKAVYKSDMFIYGNELSGLMVMKRSSNGFRVVFLSELGLKYFDMEFIPAENEVKVHFINSMLDRKPVRKKLKSGLELIFMMRHPKAKYQFYRDSGVSSMIFLVKHRRQKSYYTYDKYFGFVHHIRHMHRSEVIAVSLNNYDDAYPGTIRFNQPHLSYSLHKLETTD
ncbi:MAG: hypothetical protein P8100_05480 [bacterium]|jgi:hypothetical protein